MRPPEFNPPYDSPIEEIFAYEYTKCANKSVDLISQYPVSTICGNFIIDFVALTENGRAIGIECDGKDFHDEGRDEWRDALILGDTNIDSIYRFQGTDIFNSMHNCLYLILQIDPILFSERGSINTRTRASIAIKDEIIDPLEEKFIFFDMEINKAPLCYLKAKRFHKLSTPWPRTFWKEIYKYACAKNGGDLDEIIRSFFENGCRTT